MDPILAEFEICVILKWENPAHGRVAPHTEPRQDAVEALEESHLIPQHHMQSLAHLLRS